MVLTMQNKRKNKILKRIKRSIPIVGLFLLPISIVVLNLYYFSPLALFILFILFIFLLIALSLFKDDREMLKNILKKYLNKFETFLIKSKKDKYYKIKKDKREDL